MKMNVKNEQTNYAHTRKSRNCSKPIELSKYNINYKHIAKWFGYKSDKSFSGSQGKQDVLLGIAQLIQYIEEQNKKGV